MLEKKEEADDDDDGRRERVKVRESRIISFSPESARGVFGISSLDFHSLLVTALSLLSREELSFPLKESVTCGIKERNRVEGTILLHYKQEIQYHS